MEKADEVLMPEPRDIGSLRDPVAAGAGRERSENKTLAAPR